MGKLYQETVERYRAYVMPTYAPQVLFVKGQGAKLWDDDGTEYLDFGAGISVCNLGHCYPRITEAVQKQSETLLHVSNLYMNPVMPRLAEALVKHAFDGVVFFANSGGEANEGMIKFARKYGNATGRNHIISMENSFHGRTLATLAATGRAKYRKGFEPDTPGFSQVPFNDIEALKAAITPQTCAILLEPVQGEGGILPARLDYLKAVRALCDEKDILLLFDEVQCGMGRIGTRFAFQSFGVEPDAFSMAKAIAGGLPMGAFMVKRKYANVLSVGQHASTFGGTAIVSAAALAVQQAFDEDGVLENCQKMGEYLKEELTRVCSPYSFFKEVRGMGLMLGVVLDRPAAPLAALCLEQKLVVLTAGETVLRLLPPLIITKEEADEAVRRIADACKIFAEQLKNEVK